MKLIGNARAMLGLLAALSAPAFWSACAASPAPSILVAGRAVAIGDARASVLSSMSGLHLQCFADRGRPLPPLTDCESMFVMLPGPPYVLVANIVFRGGRVSKVLRYWPTDANDTAQSLFEQMHGILEDEVQRGHAIELNASEERGPTGSTRSIWLFAGRKTITLQLVEGMIVEGARQPPVLMLHEEIE